MSYLGDYLLGSTVSCRFTTVQATGAPTTLSGSPVISCYPSGTTTELTAGVTLTVDYDSRTGLNNVAVVASGGNAYAVSTDYDIVITTGTVNSVSVVGYVVGTFSIQNRFTNVTQIGGTTQTAKDLGAINVTNLNTLSGHDPGATLGTSTLTQAQVTGGAYTVQSSSCVLGDARVAQLDAAVTTRMATYTQPTGFLAATFPGTVASTTNITGGTITTVTTLTNLPSIPANWITAAGINTAAFTSAKFAAGAIDAAALATDAGNEIADAILDRDMSTGTDSGSTTVRTPRQALRALRNKASIAGGTLTVTKEDDATSSWTAAVTTTAGDPISAIDPAGP